jgi:hypothetical protein
MNTPIDKCGKVLGPRTQWGILCPAETPEGHGVGCSLPHPTEPHKILFFVHAVCKLTSANHAAGTIGGRMAAAADSILNSSPSALALSTLQRAHAAAFIDSHDALGLAITCYPMYLRPINSTGVGGVP